MDNRKEGGGGGRGGECEGRRRGDVMTSNKRHTDLKTEGRDVSRNVGMWL